MLNSWPLAKDLQVLVEIVHSGSFSAAAATLGQTPAFVTKRIQILENTLATTLLNRSARGVALTESGQRCYEHALEILTQYQRLVDDVTQIKTRPEGMIRIGCSFGFGRSHIAPAITELMRNYPELQVHFELFDRQIDLVQDNIDLDIRINDEIPDYYIAHLAMGAGGQRDYAAFRVGCVAVSGEWQTGASIARVCTKRQYLGCLPGAALSQHEITCLRGISGGMVPATAGQAR